MKFDNALLCGSDISHLGYIQVTDSLGQIKIFPPNEWTFTKEAAILEANRMKRRVIQELQEQIEALEELKF